MRPAIIFGTRSEYIRLIPIFLECEKRRIPYVAIYTGQHHALGVSRQRLEEIGIKEPVHYLDVWRGTGPQQIANQIINLELVLETEKPNFVVVQGGTLSSLAGAMTAAEMGLSTAHVDSCLRSGARDVEEFHRMAVDDFSSIQFVSSENAYSNPGNEPLLKYNSGSTTVDAIKHLADPEMVSPITPPYLLAAIRKPSNIDDPIRLKRILHALKRSAEKEKETIILIAEPRVKDQVSRELVGGTRIKLIPILDYTEFLALEKNAGMIITDSGSIQEEACILNIPCITIREETERKETIEVGANVLINPKQSGFGDTLIEEIHTGDSFGLSWKSPYGENAGFVIMNILEEIFG